MLTATPTTMMQALPGFPETSLLIPVGLVALTLTAITGAALSIWFGNGGDQADGQQSKRPAMQPVPSEETERQLAKRDPVTPDDHVARQRLEHLTDATRDHWT